MKYSKYIITMSVLLTLCVLSPQVQGQATVSLSKVLPWDKDTVELFSILPVQDGGRVKPMDTYAQFVMLKINGKRSLTLPSDDRLKPVPWLMNCLFYPEEAATYRHFVVDTSEVITSMGITAHDKKRDRYSYAELLPGRPKLRELASKYGRIEAKQRTSLQQQILNLYHNMDQFESLIGFLNFGRNKIEVAPDSWLATYFPGETSVNLGALMSKAPAMIRIIRENPDGLSKVEIDKLVNDLNDALHSLQHSIDPAGMLAMFPPEDKDIAEWSSPAMVISQALSARPPEPALIDMLAGLATLADIVDDRTAFQSALGQLHGQVRLAADGRGEYQKVELEVAYYRGKYIFYAQWLFVLSFVFVAMTWLFPGSKLLGRVTTASVIVPTALLIIGITFRCIVRSRPPVTTLYETMLFITACAVLAALAMEFMNRKRIALAMGSILGAMGMFLAYRYEVKEGMDTMPSMVAVLDTNFWLSTHVTSITIGYSAALLAAGLAHVYVFGKLFNIKRNDAEFYDTVTRMIYGIVCFCLLFSLVGTILGGIWANESWGRFWGWDPKENGALLICIWGLIILHARLGKYIEDLGMSLTSIVLGMVTMFSWFGVNQLGVGLHSYGFTSGIMQALSIFWAIESFVILLGLFVYLRGLGQTPEETAT
jgi:ABC-type transport system involved in cytochrome c biogenesis permease subunit